MNAQPAEIQNDVKAEPAIFTATVQVIRAGTGKVDEYTLTGTALPEEKKEPERRADVPHARGGPSCLPLREA